MVTQGCVVDRRVGDVEMLAGLSNVIKPELVTQVLLATGKTQSRKATLNFETTLWTVLAMGIFTDLPIRDVFRFMHLCHAERLPGRSALCRARKRLGSEPIRQLHRRAVGRIGQATQPGCFYHHLRLVGIDGSLFTTPDTAANARAFGRPQGGNTRHSQGAFPQVGKVSLVELGTHVELAFQLRTQKQGEQTIGYRLTKQLQRGDLLLMDAGIYCFRMAKQAQGEGAEFLARCQKRTLPAIERLADGSYVAKVYAHSNHRRDDRNGLTVRVIEYTLDEPCRTGHGQPHRLLTSLLDAEKYPAKELIALYHQRWEHELVFDEQKTHQDPRRAQKPTHLRSQSPAGVLQELYALSLAHFVVRKLMYDAAKIEQIDVDRISFSGSIRILKYRLSESRFDDLETWYRRLTAEVAGETIERRRNRINPRVLRQSRSKWKTKKTQHYSLQQPTQTFEQSIVIAT